MLHFFINTGIRDNAYYWNELLKCLKVYIALKKICPSLDSLNIGGVAVDPTKATKGEEDAECMDAEDVVDVADEVRMLLRQMLRH